MDHAEGRQTPSQHANSRRSPHSSRYEEGFMMPEDPDYQAVAIEAFGASDAADVLEQCVRHLSRYKSGIALVPPVARRRQRLDRLTKTAASLRKQLDELDDSTRGDLFRRSQTPSAVSSGETIFFSAAIAGPLRRDGYQDAVTLADLLDHLIESAPIAMCQEPLPTDGRPERDDPLVTGVESLAAIWRRHADKAPTRSNKSGGFGLLARRILMSPPLLYPEASVRHAVDRYLGRKSDRASLPQ